MAVRVVLGDRVVKAVKEDMEEKSPMLQIHPHTHSAVMEATVEMGGKAVMQDWEVTAGMAVL